MMRALSQSSHKKFKGSTAQKISEQFILGSLLMAHLRWTLPILCAAAPLKDHRSRSSTKEERTRHF